jgi:hypothetical protein
MKPSTRSKRTILLGITATVAWLALSAQAQEAPAPESPRATASDESPVAADAMPKVTTSAADVKPAGAGRKSNDRLDLDTTVVTGNRELPKVLYIVPWKKSNLGELPGQPFNTLLDEALTPVDRDVFRREVTYYGAVSGATVGASAAPPNEIAPTKAQ